MWRVWRVRVRLTAPPSCGRLSRSLQKLQRAGIVSKVKRVGGGGGGWGVAVCVAAQLQGQERHQGTDEDQNVYTLAQVRRARVFLLRLLLC